MLLATRLRMPAGNLQNTSIRMLYIRRVEGDSMQPALRKGQIVLACTAKVYRINDIVMFRHGGLEKIKRISQIEGNKIFLLGDNPPTSTDSRSFGWLNSDKIVAKVFYPRISN